MKAGFLGPRIIVLKMTFLKINARIMKNKIAKIDLMMCHLNSSRCSRNDISFSPFFPLFKNEAMRT
jgi:hypothetical protein